MQIMDRIRAALKTDERKQIDIATAADMQPENLSQFKAGDRDLPLKTLVKLASVLGLEITIAEKKKAKR